MTGLPLIFLGGMLGSAHCVGMCGGIALMVGMRSESRSRNAITQGTFTLGRIFTYAVLGGIAGAAGARFQHVVGEWVNVRGTLSLVTGLFLVAQGLHTLGVTLLPGLSRLAGSKAGCLLTTGFRQLLNGPGYLGAFLAGMFTGMLPCGLVYGFTALAATTGDPINGAALMAIFGAGTAPVMILTGWGSSLVRINWRTRLLKLAACCLVLTGGIAIAKGVEDLKSPAESPPAQCPFCITR